MVDATIITGIISTLGLILVARVKLTGDKDSAKGPDWQAFADQQRQSITDLKTEMKELRGEVKTLEGRLDALERKYRAALAFIRHLLGAHPQHREDAPTEIEGDL